MNERFIGGRFTGVVMRSTGSWYEVRALDDGVGGEGLGCGGGFGGGYGGGGSLGRGGEIFKARVRGRMRLAGSRSTNPVVVGDRVECSVSESVGSAAGAGDVGGGGGSVGAGDVGGAEGSGGLGRSGRSGGAEVWIEKVLPRENYIIRRSSNLSRESHVIAANLDQAVVVATLFSPATAPEFIDRFLVTCEAYRIPAAIVLNKIDLALAKGSEGGDGGELAGGNAGGNAGDSMDGGMGGGMGGGAGGNAHGEFRRAVDHFVDVYRGAGYRVMLTSGVTGQGISELRELLGGRTTLVSGNSGVGKSTLIKAVSPGLDIRIGEISRAHGKGMHTTTFSQMYRLGGGAGGGFGGGAGEGCGGAGGGFDGGRAGEGCGGSGGEDAGGGGYIIDTPGIKGFGLIDIGGGELYHYFPDLMRVAPDCQYYNCTHTHEPGCAVVRAVEEGRIAEQRYVSYLKMLEEDEKYRK